MSDLTPSAGAATPAKTTAEQKLDQIAAVIAKAQATPAAASAAKAVEANPTDKPKSDAKSEAASPEDKADAAKAPQVERDPIVDLLTRLQTASVGLTDRDAGLARGINQLAERATKPGATEQAMFRTQVAYSLQDMEKVLGAGRIAVPAELRSEMSQLAATSPGLTNKPMEALLRSTPDIDDRGLVRDLRRAAASIATMGPDQNAPPVNQAVDALENRVRLAPRVAAPEAGPVPASAGLQLSRQEIAPEVVQGRGAREEARVAASPGDTVRHVPQRAEAAENVAIASPGAQQGAKPKTAMAQIMYNLRPGPSASPPPWSPPALAMGERLSRFQERLDQGKTDQLIRATEKSGVAFMKSLDTFANGPGAEVLGKIDAAASTEPGGIRAVMQQMQPGGRYAELRTQFDNALQSDRVFAAAYNQIEKTGAQYGRNRLALNADFDAKKLDARQLDARFQKAEEAIGEATERIPGRAPGKSAMDELGQKVAELFNKAVQTVRSMFNREQMPEQRASASPGMSP